MAQVEICFFGLKLKFWRYLRMLRQIYIYDHYNFIKESLRQSNINLPAEAKNLLDQVEVVNIKLKDIKLPGNQPLQNSHIYAYIMGDEKGEYSKKWYHGGARIYDPEMAMNSYNDLKNDINESGYDPAKGIIVLDDDNVLIDGQHRCCLLLKKYGEDYTVKAVRPRRYGENHD